MLESSYEQFLRAPTGRFTITGSSFVWCASRTLCGSVLWGRQSEAETGDILRIFDQDALHMDRSFAIVLDSRGVNEVDPRALHRLVLVAGRPAAELAPRIRLQASVISEGPIGFLLTGLLPVVGKTHPYRVFTDPAEAFRAVDSATGAALCSEVDAIAERVRGVPRELRVTRELLAKRIGTGLPEVSAALAMSERSVQRVLSRHGTSFHDEVVTARFALAGEILRSTDAKLAEVCTRVGISERALTLLFRKKTGLTPAEWRKQAG
jgi:AraC-like DNA-binding protein